MLLSCNFWNNRNCLILDACSWSCNCPNCQKGSDSCLCASDSYILLDISFCNCNISYTLWVFVSENWIFISEKAKFKVFTLPLLHIYIQREEDQCCVLFVGIFCAGMPGSNLGSCQNSVLKEWLWDHCGVFLLFLPPRSPELNPIELVWNTMVQRLKSVPLQELYLIGAHSSAIASMQILNGITQDLRESCI